MNVQRLLDELKSEAKITRRVLERIPADRMSWTPHPKSTPLGKLGWHIALIPVRIATVLTEQKSVDLASYPPRPAPATPGEIVAGFDESIASALEILAGIPAGEWSDELIVRRGDKIVFQLPKSEIARTVLVKHLVHHRGQLSVYLRLLDVPVPSIYGPSADEAL